MNKKIRIIGVAALALLWLTLSVLGWLTPAKDISDWERRPLAQFPETKLENILSTKFMSDFESFSLDQFPARDLFRQLKSLVHFYVLGQKDSNDIYVADGYAAKQEYPLNEDSITYAAQRFNHVYETYFKDSGSKIYTAVIPDKGYYMGQGSGHLTMDYDALFEQYRQQMSWAEHIDLTENLNLDSYYKTDTHWRQEKLLPAAKVLCQALGVPAPEAEEFTEKEVEKPFYGVYYGQAALPMKPDRLMYLESQRLRDCAVFNYTTNSYADVYDLTKESSKDLYDVFLSGPQSLMRIENPNGATDRELIIFRDSFGSAIAPLLVSEYKTVTLVDIRYITPGSLEKFLELGGQDVLFLYSALVINNSSTIK